MKTISFRLSCAAALSALVFSLSGCVNEVLPELPAEEETSLSGTFDFTLDATMGDMSVPEEDEDTKASVTTVVRLSWTAGDRISVVNLTTGKALGGSLTANETGTTTTFSGRLTGTVNSGDKVAFIYPSQEYAAEQDYTPVTVDFSSQTGHLNSGVPLCVYSVVTAGGNSFNRTSASFKFLMSYIQMNMFGLEETSVINSVSVDNIGSGVTIGITSTGITSTPVQGTITMTPPSTYKVKDDGTRAFYMSFAESAAVPGRTVTVSTENEYKSCPWTGAKLNNSTSYTTSLAKFTDARYVDLGLSVKWASYNVGASAPEGYGDYFAWGETEPYYSSQSPLTWKEGKSGGYTLANDKYYRSEKETVDEFEVEYKGYTKYVPQSKAESYGFKGFYDNKTALDPEDDAARANLGEGWRMPTDEEWTELRNTENCTWIWTTLNGVNGYKVQSKKEGYTEKWIFLPAAGYRYGANFYYAGSFGNYWSSSLNTGSTIYAYNVNFDSSGIYRDKFGSRYGGRSVRPVHIDDPNAGITGISLNKTSATIELGWGEPLIATVTRNSGAVNYSYVEWSSSDPSVATVDQSGVVTSVAEGTATITARTVFGGFTATCSVVVSGQYVAPSKMVDLGLSVKWASYNVGATAPEEYGDYFAWGATEPWYEAGYARKTHGAHWKTGKSGGYSWGNTPYQTANNPSESETRFTKYLGSTTSSYKDASATDADAIKTVLDLEDDAARANWGGSWRMPTDAEWGELSNTSNCTWTWATLNGVNGYKVQSKKTGYTDKWIFLPAAGNRFSDILDYVGSYGVYWSSFLRTGYPFNACYVFFDSGIIYGDYIGRFNGLSVRPVSK